jgi:beta-1,4-galactosyltransferase 1
MFNRKKLFTKIYETRFWNGEESASGHGADTKFSEAIREVLPKLIKDYNIKTILDIGCGEFNWMKQVDLHIDKYIGVDIVDEIVRRNNDMYGSGAISFKCLDVCSDDLPKVDLIICRDCHIHMSFREISSSIKKFKQSNSTYLLASTWRNKKNINKRTDLWREINLEIKPFNLPEPILKISEDIQNRDMGLWRIDAKSQIMKSQVSRKDKKLIIIVPFRDREEHLNVFVPYLKSFLKNINHEIVIIEQVKGKILNRGKIKNIGFDLMKDNDSYFCFHDIDMLPQNKKCDYGFPLTPVHLAHYWYMGEDIPSCPKYFGGVVLFNKEDFEKVNGYSNEYWGWGCEDTDLSLRVTYFNLHIEYKPGRYECQPHEREGTHSEMLNTETYKKNFAKMNSGYDYKNDGLSTLKYEVLKKEVNKDYIKYVVEV